MTEQSFTASQMFRNANRFIEAYHTALLPVCRDTGLPPMAVDILMFIANNPESSTAKDVCQCRGFKSGIVSVHVDRLVNEGLLVRQDVPGDRRKTLPQSSLKRDAAYKSALRRSCWPGCRKRTSRYFAPVSRRWATT